jgi:hypothetical protein
VQKTLVDALKDFGADQKAKDASRVLRLVKTVNTQSGEIVRVLHVEEANQEPIRYGFDAFADEVLPYTREQTADYKKRKAALNSLPGGKPGNLKRFSGRRLAWHRLEDIRALAKLRGWQQTGVPEGSRDLYLFWSLNFLLLSGATHAGQMHYEAEALTREICPRFTSDHNLRTLLSTLYRKAKEHEAGVTIEFDGKKYPPLYTPKNSTLLDVFEITSDEEKRLRTIISTNEATERRRERDRERNRAVENQTREQYLAKAEINRQEAIRLHHQSMSLRNIADKLSVSVGAVRHYLKGCAKSSPITMA